LYGEERLLAYRASNAFVFCPEVFEETGTVCLEALACNLPVISSEQASIPYLGQKDGVISVRNSISNIISAMRLLMTNDLPVDSAKIHSFFDWSVVSKQMLTRYEK